MTQQFCCVEFHARVQTVAYCINKDGEIHHTKFERFTTDFRFFYSPFPGNKIVGLEVIGYSDKSECLMEELGC